MGTSDNNLVKYGSRKFMVTAATIIVTTALAYFGKMDADAALVFAAAIASYNWANSRMPPAS